MKYYSTRNKSVLYPLKEAASMGLAPDGGLFMPESIPEVDMKVVLDKAAISFADMAIYLAELFFGEDVNQQVLCQLIKEVYDFPLSLRKLGKEKYTLELFHGPTFAFKDFGAGFMGKMLSVLNSCEKELIILTATSGDTGSAVARGFYKVPGIKVVILYPAGKISNLQESQMTTLGDNIYPLKVEGTFDDCQKLVKEIFNDHTFRNLKNVTSANSINILRWIPQSFYYFYGYYLWQKEMEGENPVIAVPSGNYGNLSAGMMAQKMGLPVEFFIAASNANDIIPEFLKTGEFVPRPSVKTLANAMDVGNPSNYERMICLYENCDMGRKIKGYSCSDIEIKKAITEIYKDYHYISDPHSAIGYNAMKYYGKKGFWLSTAHPAKFREVIKESLGIEYLLPEKLKVMMQQKKSFISMKVNTKALKEYISSI